MGGKEGRGEGAEEGRGVNDDEWTTLGLPLIFPDFLRHGTDEVKIDHNHRSAGVKTGSFLHHQNTHHKGNQLPPPQNIIMKNYFIFTPYECESLYYFMLLVFLIFAYFYQIKFLNF